MALRLKFRPCTADISVVRLGDMALDMCPLPLRTRGCARARLHTRAPYRRRRFGRGEPSPGTDVGALHRPLTLHGSRLPSSVAASAVTGYPAEYPDRFRYYIGSGRLVSDMEEDANHFVEASSHLGRFPLRPIPT